MPIQTSKFGRIFRQAQPVQNFETLHPELGLHSGIAPNKLPQGFSPELRNMVNKRDGSVGLRYGLSSFGTYDFGGPVLGAEEVYDSLGNLAGFAPSATSFAYMHPSDQIWSELSYAVGSVVSTAVTGVPSGLSTDYWDTTTIFDPSTNSMIAVTSNNTDWSKFFYVHSDTSIFSDFTWTDSLVSTKAANAVTAIDDRLVFFNTLGEDETRYPTRVLWSTRGVPAGANSYALASGAGYEDLKDMRGYGQAAVNHKELLILFSDQEIWRALPTRDAYAFQFQRVQDDQGCNRPRTIADTPSGAVFLGKDYELYITDGSQVVALGPSGGQGPSRIQKKLRLEIQNPERAFGLYNQTDNRYELYYSTTTSTDGFPNRALFYSFEDGTFWPQTFSTSLSDGLDLEDPAALTTWDAVSDTWDAVESAWDSYSQTLGSRSVNVFDSAGSTFRFRSTSSTDDGTGIDLRWRSPGLNQQDFSRMIKATELWFNSEVPSDSSMSVLWSNNYGKTFENEQTVSLVSGQENKFVPVFYQSKHPMFELRASDGQFPEVFNFTVRTLSAGRF